MTNNPRTIYEKLIAEITDHDERKAARILSFHTGKANAITREAFAAALFGRFTTSNDRKMRAIVETLRFDGWLICNLNGGDGFFLAETPEEFQEFYPSYISHATRILEVGSRMQRKADELWGARSQQMGLGI